MTWSALFCQIFFRDLVTFWFVDLIFYYLFNSWTKMFCTHLICRLFPFSILKELTNHKYERKLLKCNKYWDHIWIEKLKYFMQTPETKSPGSCIGLFWSFERTNQGISRLLIIKRKYWYEGMRVFLTRLGFSVSSLTHMPSMCLTPKKTNLSEYSLHFFPYEYSICLLQPKVRYHDIFRRDKNIFRPNFAKLIHITSNPSI